MTKILVHGSGHQAESWDKTVAHMKDSGSVLCPNLPSLLQGQEASYGNLYASFSDHCGKLQGKLHLCGLSLGGILALNYALDHPEKTSSLVLIGTPHKIPKAAFALQSLIFRLLPDAAFQGMAFSKQDTFALNASMKHLDFSCQARQLQCPTLVVCGQKDRANLKSAYFLSQTIPNATLTILENTGHIVNEENPQALAKLLDDFYTQVEG